MRPSRSLPHSKKPEKPPYAFSAYVLLFASVFLNIQLFLYGLFTCYTHECDLDGKWIIAVGFALLVFNISFYVRFKRRQVELYREDAQALYIGAFFAIPLAQWLMHTYVFSDTFSSLGPYRYVELLCTAAWMGVLLFNFLTDIPGYDRHPNRKHWSCRLRRLFVGPSQGRY